MISQRLDEALVVRGLSQSRSRARDAILRGTVDVNGLPARKPSQGVFETDVLVVRDVAQNYVSRAAVKLLYALRHFDIKVKGRHALDIGASTGGFTQVLLEQGADHVIAIDVGHGQMVQSLASDRRVTFLEGVNARDLTRLQVPEKTSLIVCDVSFISLGLALPAALALVDQGADLVALIKPQFEVGREHIGKGGIVSDAEQHQRACDAVVAFLLAQDWNVIGVIASPVDGGDGNAEFLVYAKKP